MQVFVRKKNGLFCKCLIVRICFLFKVEVQRDTVCRQSVDADTSRVVGGSVEVDKTVREADFGGELEEFEKLFEANPVFNGQIHRTRTESAGALRLFPPDVGLDAERAPRQKIHA